MHGRLNLWMPAMRREHSRLAEIAESTGTRYVFRIETFAGRFLLASSDSQVPTEIYAGWSARSLASSKRFRAAWISAWWLNAHEPSNATDGRNERPRSVSS